MTNEELSATTGVRDIVWIVYRKTNPPGVHGAKLLSFIGKQVMVLVLKERYETLRVFRDDVYETRDDAQRALVLEALGDPW